MSAPDGYCQRCGDPCARIPRGLCAKCLLPSPPEPQVCPDCSGDGWNYTPILDQETQTIRVGPALICLRCYGLGHLDQHGLPVRVEPDDSAEGGA